MKRIIVEGHRGYCSKYPENTLVSIENSLDLEIDAFEFDLWLTKDDEVVLMHDATAYRTCGVDRKIKDMTLAEIKELDAGSKFAPEFAGEKVPTFREVLELVKNKRPDIMHLGVEIKDMREKCVDKVVALLKEYGMFERSFFYAFNARIIKYLKVQYNANTMGYPDFQMAEFEPDSYSYYDHIGLNLRLTTSEIFEFYKAKGFPMHLYCMDDEETVKIAVEKGADFITANNPVPLIKYLKEIGSIK